MRTLFNKHFKKVFSISGFVATGELYARYLNRHVDMSLFTQRLLLHVLEFSAIREGRVVLLTQGICIFILRIEFIRASLYLEL